MKLIIEGIRKLFNNYGQCAPVIVLIYLKKERKEIKKYAYYRIVVATSLYYKSLKIKQTI